MKSTTAPRLAGALTLAALAVALPAPASVAAPGDLDPTFGTGGVAVVDEGDDEWVNGLVAQPDGKVIGVGTTSAGPDNSALVFRLGADGRVDQAFGYRHLDVPGGHSDSGDAAALQPDGRIVVAGYTTKNQDAAVWRLLPNGAPDPSFGGGDGLVTLDRGSREFLYDIAVAPDGGVVAVGSTDAGGGQAVVYRLTPAGDPDPTFDQDGVVTIGSSYSSARAVAVQPDGRIVMTGQFAPSTGMIVRRLTVTGAPDPDFGGGDGEAHSDVVGYPYDLALQADGRIVVAGETPGPSGTYDALMLRYHQNGNLDQSFGTQGTRFDLGGDESIYSVALLPGGGVVASGTTDAGEEAFVVKTGANGQPDGGFGVAGGVLLPGTIETGYAVAAQPDGHVLVAGDDSKYLASALVYRLIGDYAAALSQPTPVQSCGGKPATIVGTEGKDRLTGTNKADVVVALGGDDLVTGLGGDDLVCAGDGDDTVKGGPGKDILLGEKGKDRLVGGTGKDRLVGGPQRDHSSQRS